MVKPLTSALHICLHLQTWHDSICKQQKFAQQQITFYQEKLLLNNIDPHQKTHMRGQLNIWSQDELQLKHQRIEIRTLIEKVAEFESNYHDCKYCHNVTDGTNQDLLCETCRVDFGHERFSEL